MRKILIPLVILSMGAAVAAFIDPLFFSIYIIGVPIAFILVFLVKKFGTNFLAWTMSRSFRKTNQSMEKSQPEVKISSGPKVNMSIGTKGIEDLKLSLPTGQPGKPADIDPRDIAIEAIGYGQAKLVHEIITSNRSDEQVQKALDLIESSRRSELEELVSTEDDNEWDYSSIPRSNNPYSLSREDGSYSVE